MQNSYLFSHFNHGFHFGRVTVLTVSNTDSERFIVLQKKYNNIRLLVKNETENGLRLFREIMHVMHTDRTNSGSKSFVLVI